MAMPSTMKSEPAEVSDYSCLMADGHSREFIWGKVGEMPIVSNIGG